MDTSGRTLALKEVLKITQEQREACVNKEWDAFEFLSIKRGGLLSNLELNNLSQEEERVVLTILEENALIIDLLREEKEKALQALLDLRTRNTKSLRLLPRYFLDRQA